MLGLAGELVLCPAGQALTAVLESLSKSPPAAPRHVRGRTETRAPAVARSSSECLSVETAIPRHCQGESCCRHGGDVETGRELKTRTWLVGRLLSLPAGSCACARGSVGCIVHVSPAKINHQSSALTWGEAGTEGGTHRESPEIKCYVSSCKSD